ncbi:MAG: hypothetical protein JKY37_27695 [Nannocystaceae bacterium]|nr:hypothetical protein [Nannocystaceae bacterium]
MRRTLILLVSLLPACGSENRDVDDTLPTSMTAVSGDTSASAGDGGSSDEGFDPPPPSDLPDVDPDAGVGCNAVDFLFVIDNSGSMADEQQHLIDSVPGFVAAIEQRLPPGSGSYHIMVTDVDPWVYEACEEACVDSAQCETQSETAECDCGYPCALRTLCIGGGKIGGDYACGSVAPETCEAVAGAGVTHPRGRDASNRDCEFSSGERYVTNIEPDLTAAIDCAARVGTSSSVGEKPMFAMMEALTGAGEVAACNEGFLRDDAVLVVTIITDEDDNGPHADDLEGDSPGSPSEWFDALVAVKGGNEKAIVALALIGDNDQPAGICAPLDHATFDGAEAAPRIRDFVGRFGTRGKVASVCADNYEEFFMQTVDTIGEACEEFQPEG